MPKKITIVSAVSLVLLIGVIMLAVKLSEKTAPANAPKKVSIYDKEESVIYTPDYEDLLCGCVEGMLIKGVEFEPEALKAIAIAENARINYFLEIKDGFDGLGADLTVCEEIPYTPAKPNTAVRTAVNDALKLSLVYNDEPFDAPICKISAGRTDELLPYSPSVGLPCDIDAPYFLSSTEISAEEVSAALGGNNLPWDGTEWFKDPVYNDNGTLMFIKFNGERVSGENLRKALNLRSTAISAEYTEGKFVFKCQGWGENCGMSIYAANYLAQKGKTAEEILDIFYPNAKLKSAG